MSETSEPTEPSTVEKNQHPFDQLELLQQIRSTLMAVKSVFDHTFEMSQARLLFFQEVQGSQEISQSEIHQKMGMDPAIITRIVKQMEAAGQITRRPDPADNRYTLVRMTELGQSQFNQMQVKGSEMGSLLLQGLSAEEINQMISLLKRIQTNAEAQVTPTENGPTAKAA